MLSGFLYRERLLLSSHMFLSQFIFHAYLSSSAAVTGLNHTSVTARVGDEVTLPCDNVIKTRDKCNSTSWLASRSGESAKQLVNLGQISKSEIPKSRSDRLSVTESCSLVIKNISVEDVGRYTCRQFNKSGKQQGEDALVYLSVVNGEYLNLYVFKSNCFVRTKYQTLQN